MNSSPSRPSVSRRSKIGGISVVLLVGLYSVLVPHINDRFDLDLPAIQTDSEGNIRSVDADGSRQPTATIARDSKTNSDKPKQSPATASIDSKRSTDDGNQAGGRITKAPGPLADRMRRSAGKDQKSTKPTSTAKQPNAAQPSNIAQSSEQASVDEELYGMLREVSRDRYLSPAGLLYTPGSAEGHRLEHLRRHTKDDPGRPGKHGVFDGDMEGALKTIDMAYERAMKGQKTTKKTDEGRTIYTVDMGGRVGFVGGRDGNRKRKPMARRVRLVLDGNRVITAYPL